MMRVLLVDDQRLVREGLRVLLEMEPDIEAVLEAQDGVQAPELYLNFSNNLKIRQ